MDCLKMNLYSENKLPRISIGEEQIDQRLTSFNSRYTFSAKEKDIETGYSYFGARYYTSDLSIWLSVDPMSDKYPSLTPYNYCANNPIKLVDPNGKEVFVTGRASEEFTAQLQATTSNLIISRNEKSGKLSVEGKAKTRDERKLVKAINSERVTVRVESEYTNTIDPKKGDPIAHNGGAFMGNMIVSEEGKRKCVVATQLVNPESLCEKSDYNGKYYGESARHEVTEAYKGGLISLRRGKPASMALGNNRVYNRADRWATDQPDESGNTSTPYRTTQVSRTPYQRQPIF